LRKKQVKKAVFDTFQGTSFVVLIYITQFCRMLMGNIKSRIVKLEKSMLVDPAPVRIARFIIRPGVEPDSYTLNGVEVVVREFGESSESLRKRCHEAVSWPDAPCSRLVFYPQQSESLTEKDTEKEPIGSILPSSERQIRPLLTGLKTD
jgi:hypothetical protein